MRKHYSFKELESITGKTPKQLSNLIFKLGIETVMFRGKRCLKKDEAEKLINYKPKNNSKFREHPRKIAIIEEYIRVQSKKAVVRNLEVNMESVRNAINEWEDNNGYIVVESSISRDPKRSYSGVFEKGKKWAFETSIKGKRLYKGGFNTEEEALAAKIECRKKNS